MLRFVTLSLTWVLLDILVQIPDPAAKEFFLLLGSRIDMLSYQMMKTASAVWGLEGARSSVDAAFCGFLTAGAKNLDLPFEQKHQRYQPPSLVVLIAENIAATITNCGTLFE